MRPSSELRDLVSGYFRSFTAGDPDWVERHVLNGDEFRLIGTNAEEWLAGSDGFDTFRHEAAAASGALDATVSDVEAFCEGDVGWGAALVRFSLSNGQSARARFSAVFVTIDGTWKLVSSHTSIPVPDEDAFSAD
ncbi:MAG: SnoaL-like domain-containing protein [Ilumatobacter sp.]|nr:SnoaL-like domain-containing protein [Ilumatobacter sp.]